MNAHSGKFLYRNIAFAIQYIDHAPPEAQKALIRALIKEIVVHQDYIEIKMYMTSPR